MTGARLDRARGLGRGPAAVLLGFTGQGRERLAGIGGVTMAVTPGDGPRPCPTSSPPSAGPIAALTWLVIAIRPRTRLGTSIPAASARARIIVIAAG